MSSSKSSHSILLGLGAVLLLGGAGLSTLYFVGVSSADATIAQPKLVGELPTSDAELGAVRAKTSAFLAKPLVVKAGERSVEVRWADFGATVDEESVKLARLDDKGDLSGAVPVSLDPAKISKTLSALKIELDQSPRSASLDLEGRKVIPAASGVVIDILGSSEVALAAARMGKSELELAATVLPAEASELGIDDISTVLATFTSKYKVSDGRRNDNLKLLASRIDGVVMQPGEVFSFNETSGARTEKEGYKMAHVIMKGEMVDGMAGGACQISTTLNGAAFLAGIELVESTPHSRPSTYAPRGLDATVVYPTTDLKLRNTYDFPIAIHFKIARGLAKVELLGREKPFDRVEWSASTVRAIPFDTITREDNRIGVGHMVTDQKGENGFKVKRYRKVFKDGKIVKSDQWDLSYRPVIQYLRMGTNTDPNLPPPKRRRGH